MGDPTDPYDYDPGKWYDCNMDIFNSLYEPSECDKDYYDYRVECVPGITLINYYLAGGDCVLGNEIISCGGTSCQRVKRITGPFDTLIDCLMGS